MIRAVFLVTVYLFGIILLLKLARDWQDTFTFRRSRNKICFRIADGWIVVSIPLLVADLWIGLLSIATGMLLRGTMEVKEGYEKAYAPFIENTNPRRLK